MAVLPEYRKTGIGTDLINSTIEEMKKRGKLRLTGHFLPDSCGLMEKKKAEKLAHFENWYESGKPSDYMALRV